MIAVPRYFTLDEANRLLPDVEQIVRRLRRVRQETAGRRTRLEERWAGLEREETPLSAVAEEQAELDRLQAEFEALVEELEGHGAILRDLQQGLVDFLTVAGVAEVYLCWRLGEPSIGFWHGLGEGYAGRKPIGLLPGGAH